MICYECNTSAVSVHESGAILLAAMCDGKFPTKLTLGAIPRNDKWPTL